MLNIAKSIVNTKLTTQEE